MQQELLLSIIIPYYNTASLLKELLNTIPKNIDCIETIIINDHSNENLKEYEAIKQDYINNNN